MTIVAWSRMAAESLAAAEQLATEGIDIQFTEDAIDEIAQTAGKVNERTENIGARRLHTVLERLLDTVSYEAPDRSGDAFEVNASYVNEHLDQLAGNEDLSRYIL